MSNWAVRKSGGGQSLAMGVGVNGGSADGFGSWVQITSSLPSCAGLMFSAEMDANVAGIWEFGIGASGSEVVIADQIVLPAASSLSADATEDCTFPSVFLPLKLPAGQRLAMRYRAAVASGGSKVTVRAVAASPLFETGIARANLHAYTSGPSGTTVIAGGGYTFGSWVELVASADYWVRGVQIVCGESYVDSFGNDYGRFEIGIGAAGSELPIARLDLSKRYFDWPGVMLSPVLPVAIASGQRIAVRSLSLYGSLYVTSALMLWR